MCYSEGGALLTRFSHLPGGKDAGSSLNEATGFCPIPGVRDTEARRIICVLTYIRLYEYCFAVELIQIYKCLCEPIRLRIVNLLAHGPLCVCHFQDVLRLPQTKVSQHLAYLRKYKMVETTRKGTWIIYSLPAKASAELEANLKCLQACATSDKLFRADITRLATVKQCSGWVEKAVSQKSCC